MNAPARPVIARQAASGSLAFWFLVLLSLRLVSEGVDYYLGTPLSIILTAGLTAVSTIGVLASGPLPRRMYGFVGASIALLASSLLTVIANSNFDLAVQGEQFTKYFSYCAVFLFCALYKWREDHIRLLLAAMGITMVAQFGFGLFQVVTGTGYNQEFGLISRAFGLTAHPLPLSYLLLTMMAFVFLYRKYISDVAQWAFFSMAAITMLLTLSRTGWIMAALWLVMILVRKHPANLKLFTVIFITPILVLALYLSGRFDDLQTLPEFITHRRYEYWNWRVTTNSYEWRLVQWYGLLEVGAQSMWLGHGLGSTPTLNEFELKAHNSFIDMFVEGGMAGVVSFIWFMGALLQLVRRSVRKPLTSRGIPIERWDTFVTYRATGLSLVFGYLAAMALASSLFNNPLMMFVFFLDLGLICNIPFRQHLATKRLQQRLARAQRRDQAVLAPA